MLTDNQIQQIIQSINNMLDRVRPHLEGLDSICDLDYSKGREKQPVTMAVYSAFIPDNQCIEGAEIVKGFYGKSMCLPELHIENEIYQLYNHSAHPYGTKEVIGKIDEYGKEYHIIEFSVSEEYRLSKLELIDFEGLTENNRGKIKRRISLL